MSLLRFPEEWMTLGMYPDALFELQLSGYELGHEDSPEHDRNGAFHWWLRQPPTRVELENLLRLAALDPDSMLGDDWRQYIYKAAAFDEMLAALDQKLFQNV